MPKPPGPETFLLSPAALESPANGERGWMAGRPRVLRDVDLWRLRKSSDWWHFEARMPEMHGVRGYRMSTSGGPIIADSPPMMVGIFELGGPAVGMASPGGSDLPYHVFSAADDIGPAGMAGLQRAPRGAGLARFRERTGPALVADTLAHWSFRDRRAIPLFYVRTETGVSGSIAEFDETLAVPNLAISVANWADAAEAVEVDAALGAVILDIAGDDLISSTQAYCAGVMSLLDRLGSEVFGGRLVRPVPVFTLLDSGCQRPLRPEMIAAQWELSLFHGGYSYCVAAPAYMFARRPDGWLDDTGRLHRAEMIGAAMSHVSAPERSSPAEPENEGWVCPTPLLAEWDGKAVRVTFRAETDLVLDAADPFGAGPSFGFRVLDDQGGVAAEVTAVTVAKDDPKALQLDLSRAPAPGMTLCYACGATADLSRRYPANCGAVRDEWAMLSVDGSVLRRWALPCHLKLTSV
jgi:hypothetical protein